jgi:hypothetical protein
MGPDLGLGCGSGTRRSCGAQDTALLGVGLKTQSHDTNHSAATPLDPLFQNAPWSDVA